MKQGSILNWTYIYLCILTWALDTISGNNMLSPLHIDVVILLMTCYVNSRDKYFWNAFVSGPIMIWGIWTIYSIGNWFYSPHSAMKASAHAHWYWEIFSLSRTYFMLALLYYEACLDFPRTIRLLAYAFIIYFTLGIAGQWGGPMREDEAWEGRNGTILGNHFPLNMLCSLFAITIGNIYGYITRKQLYLWTGFVTFVILWVATRKAMGGMFILIVFYVIANMKHLSAGNIIKFLFIAGILYSLFNLVLNFTLIGLRMNELKEYDFQIDVPVWLSFLGDRAIQYVLAWDVFLQHPINGVGLGNSMDYTGLPFPIHSEYMEQLCEGGMIGTALYLWFNISIFKCIRNAWNERSHRVTIICLGGMAVLLFISFTAWLYNMPCFFIIYALVIAYCNPQTYDDMPDEYNEEDWDEYYDNEEAYA